MPGLEIAAILLLLCPAGFAEEHRATHLGAPAHRFADPIVSEKDLRWRLGDAHLQPDIIAVLNQWGWKGRPTDLFKAAANNTVTAVSIPTGTVMPFMSSRESGKPICLRNVTWAGERPISAYAFEFNSNGQRYRCVTPKLCSNFFLEDLGPEPKPRLTLECVAPDRVPLGRTATVCLTVRNVGNAAESNLSLTLPLTAAAVPVSVTDDGTIAADRVHWEFAELAANSSRQVCVTFTAAQITTLPFDSSVDGAVSPPTHSACFTKVFGIPAILLEKADEPDPVSVGDTTTYTVKVTNQGTADDSNVQVVVTIAGELVPMSAEGGTVAGQTITFPMVAQLMPKQAMSYRILAKGVKAGDGHTKFTLSSDVLKSPITAEESTTVY